MSGARPPLPPGPFLVVGLVRSGRAAALALRARGAQVLGCDRAPVAEPIRAELEAAGVTVVGETDGVALLDGVATLIKSPGVPPWAAVVAAARARGVGVLGELELGWRMFGNQTIAVTGSNGKTTTSELIGAIHRAAGVPVVVAGNVGTALTSLQLAAETVVVCEASSFQLEDTECFAPDAAVLLNLAPDHLDRYGSFDAYRDAKLRIFADQEPDAIAVAPVGVEVPGRARPIAFARSAAAGVDAWIADGAIHWRGARIAELATIRLRGDHNAENALAATAVTLARGLPAAAVRAALADFAGVAHRLEEVARTAGVTYFDDSKATNVAAAVVAIRSFDSGVHAILGGRGKGEDYAPLAAALRGRARAVYLIGEEAEAIAAALERAAGGGVAEGGAIDRPAAAGGSGTPAVHLCGDLERAVAAARAAAAPGDVVLLAPACASFDQYDSFEQRGDHFKAMVAPKG